MIFFGESPGLSHSGYGKTFLAGSKEKELLAKRNFRKKIISLKFAVLIDQCYTKSDFNGCH